MGKIVMPKNSAILEEIIPVLKIYYEAGTWVSNDDYKSKLKKIIGDDQYASSYTKKAQIPSYFGFTEWEDVNNVRSRKRITERGKHFYNHYINRNHDGVLESLMTSLEEVTFGRLNSGCPDSDSDIEPPIVFIRAALDLKFLTYKEYAYLMWKMEDCGGNYTDVKKEILEHRSKASFELSLDAQKYADAKPIMFLIRLGFLAEDDTTSKDKKIIIPKNVLEKFEGRIKNLKIYNIDKNISLPEFCNSQPKTEGTSNVASPYNFYTTKGGAQNTVIYGTPGCGKSYYVQNSLLPSLGVEKQNIVRTTFYQDYTNTDFVGQILPKVQADKSVSYEFNPGPFTLALKKAIETPDKLVALVVEELNRGNAASIFGDIFQLLDRDKKNNGRSEYAITNVNIQDYLNNYFSDKNYTFDDIRIPANLYIIATMNTSDQNVFTLDTAFKRRWLFQKIRNDFDVNHEYKSYYVPGTNNVTWEQLVININKYIINRSDDLSSEDKLIGVYFVEKELLCEKLDDIKNEEKKSRFAYKLFEYLWNDVAKFAHVDWFGSDIKTLDQLIDEYMSSGEKVLLDVFK